VTGESLGLLVEESRTNSLTYSEEFDNAAWTKARTTITANAATAPDGTTTADKLIRGTDNNNNVVYQAVSLPQTTYTLSVFAKKGEYTFCTLNLPSVQGWDADRWVSVNLADGSYTTSASAPTSTSVVAYQNGWYRISITHAATATVTRGGYIEARSSAGHGNQAGDGTSGIYIWGAQFEAGSFPTSYIPTSGSTVTRSADVASMTADPYLYGTFLAKYKHHPGNDSYRQIFSVGNSSAYSAFVCRTQLQGRVNIVLPGVIDLKTTSNSEAAGFNMVATARVVGDYAVCLNGGTVATTSSSSDRTNNSVITFMYGSTGAVSGGHISRFSYYPTRLSNDQLQALTL
jgi:hypothetical protein